MRRAEAVGPDFDARRSATGRTLPLPGLERARRPTRCWPPSAWHVRDPLDLGSMRTAVRRPARRRTTSAPSAAGRPGPTPPSRSSAGSRRPAGAWTRAPRRPTPAAATGRAACCASRSRPRSFCHQMVRSLVGSLVEVGRGTAERRRPDGAAAGGLAPPHARSGPGARPVPGLGGLRARRPGGPGRLSPRPAVPAGGGLPAPARGPILVRRLAGPPGAAEPAPGRRSGGSSPTTRMRKIGLVRTFSPKVTEIQRTWYVVDADGLVLGRLASVGGGHPARQAPPLLRPPRRHRRPRDRGQRRQGRADLGQGRRQDGLPPQRLPRWPALHQLRRAARRASRPSWSAAPCAACCPRTPSAARCSSKLQVYAGPDHPHAAQKPEPLELPAGPPRRLSRDAPGRTPPTQCPHH